MQPAVTIGNVGQLATDLLISTLRLSRVGFLETTAVLPCAGNDAFSHQKGQIALSLELFHLQQPDGQLDIYLIQQRSPAAKGCQQRFAEELSEWTCKAGFREVSHMELYSSLMYAKAAVSAMHKQWWHCEAQSSTVPAAPV